MRSSSLWTTACNECGRPICAIQVGEILQLALCTSKDDRLQDTVCSDCAQNLLAVIYVVYFITINNDFPLDYTLLFSVFQLEIFFWKSLTNYFVFIYLGYVCPGRPFLFFHAQHAKGANTHTHTQNIYVCVYFVLPSCARGFVFILKADNKNGFTVMGANMP